MTMQYGNYYVHTCPDNGIERENPVTGEEEICRGYYCQVFDDENYENQIDDFCLAVGYEIPDDSYESLEKGIMEYLGIDFSEDAGEDDSPDITM